MPGKRCIVKEQELDNKIPRSTHSNHAEFLRAYIKGF